MRLIHIPRKLSYDTETKKLRDLTNEEIKKRLDIEKERLGKINKS